MNKLNRVALIADVFPPSRSSAAIQLFDLSVEMARQGIELTVIIPSQSSKNFELVDHKFGFKILFLKTNKIKDIGYFKRTLNEFLMPFLMIKNLRESSYANKKWDFIVWYSPSIFHGPFVHYIKYKSRCRAYLLIRDIFPQWALDLGLLKRGPLYIFFLAIAYYQYSLADIIGVQSHGNLEYFKTWSKKRHKRIDVLPNWLAEAKRKKSSIQIINTKLANRKIFLYAGNMGVAQDVGIFLRLAVELKNNREYGFLFVGRGSKVGELKDIANEYKLENVLFFDEIPVEEVNDLCSQCDVGLLALSTKHKTHNIPGKLLTYLRAGLPCLANVNAGNDIVKFIEVNQVGEVCVTGDVKELKKKLEFLLSKTEQKKQLSVMCKDVFERNFSVTNTVQSLMDSYQDTD